MQFIYYENTTPSLTVGGDEYKYLFKVRRFKTGSTVNVRNLKDDYLYVYKIDAVNKKEAYLSLKEKIHAPNKPAHRFHIAWCVIDPKNIEKSIPALNEIGVGKISFVYCDYSQKNFKIKLDRIKKILINSSQQCGRSDIPEIEILGSSKEFFEKYPEFYALDFDGKEINGNCDRNGTYIIGPEGGFSEDERKRFEKKIRLKGFILRSETAVISVSAKILL